MAGAEADHPLADVGSHHPLSASLYYADDEEAPAPSPSSSSSLEAAAPEQQAPSPLASASSSSAGPPPLTPGERGLGEAPLPTLRVMRLYKPKLHVERFGPVPGESRLTPHLVLPESFGKIYRGQKFEAYVSVLNSARGLELRDVTVSAKLQSPSSKRALELKDISAARRAMAAEVIGEEEEESGERRKSNPAASLDPGWNVDMIVEHGLVESGTHTLRVSVTYSLQGSDAPQKNVRKFYRFTVNEPFEVKSLAELCWTPSSRGGGALGFVECVVKNLCHEETILDDVSLHLPPGFAGRDVQARHTSSGNNRPKSLVKPDRTSPVTDAELAMMLSFDPVAELDKQIRLRPEDEYAFVFEVHRASSAATIGLGQDDDHHTEHHALPANAGWIRIGWTAPMGEPGAISTPPVDWKQASGEPTNATLRVVLVEPLPTNLAVGDSITRACRVENLAPDSDLGDLQLQWRIAEMPRTIKVAGRSHRNLGRLKRKGGAATVDIVFRAFEPGFCTLTGCAVVDLTSQRELFDSNTPLGYCLVTAKPVPHLRETLFKTPSLPTTLQTDHRIPPPPSTTTTTSLVDAIKADLDGHLPWPDGYAPAFAKDTRSHRLDDPPRLAQQQQQHVPRDDDDDDDAAAAERAPQPPRPGAPPDPLAFVV